MGRAVNMIHNACKDMIDNVTLINNDLYMLHIFDQLRDELPEFKAFLEYDFENKTSAYVGESKEKAVPLKELVKELFSPENLDNHKSTDTLDKIASIGILAFVVEMENEKKATYKYLSISGVEFSYEHCPEDVKKSMLGKMASNDLAESSFAEVTAQVHCYRRIGMSAAAAVSDVGRNGFLSRGGIKGPIDRETTIKKTKAKEKESELYFGMVKELQITLLITCMEDAPRTRMKNYDNLSRARKWRSQKEEAAKQKGNEDAV